MHKKTLKENIDYAFTFDNKILIEEELKGKEILNTKIDLTGQRFGRLLVLKEVEKNSLGKIQWLCKCDCGNTTITTTQCLRAGETKSCGCLQKEQITQLGKSQAKNLTGQKFGKLTALYPTNERKHKCVVWHCKCDCGNECDVIGSLLVNHNTSSCGCLGKSKGEYLISQLLQQYNIKFEEQKSFSSCYFIDKNHLLKFDFWVNNSYLIEFDGEQHQKPTSGWNNITNFQQGVLRDDAKNNWCKKNNIPLIRIPYSQLNSLTIEDLMLETTTFQINKGE